MATRLLARLRSAMKVDLTLEDVFTRMTVAKIAERIRQSSGDALETGSEAAPASAAANLLAGVYSTSDRGAESSTVTPAPVSRDLEANHDE
jgi:hypothetical protein